jgi:hypothetical protein
MMVVPVKAVTTPYCEDAAYLWRRDKYPRMQNFLSLKNRGEFGVEGI